MAVGEVREIIGGEDKHLHVPAAAVCHFNVSGYAATRLLRRYVPIPVLNSARAQFHGLRARNLDDARRSHYANDAPGACTLAYPVDDEEQQYQQQPEQKAAIVLSRFRRFGFGFGRGGLVRRCRFLGNFRCRAARQIATTVFADDSRVLDVFGTEGACLHRSLRSGLAFKYPCLTVRRLILYNCRLPSRAQ